MKSTATGKRLLAARVLLGLALLLTVLAVFLPLSLAKNPYGHPRDMGPSFENLGEWWQVSVLFALMFWNMSIGSMYAGVVELVFITTLLLQSSSFWLVRFYHRSRPLCWVVRILALTCAGYPAYVSITLAVFRSSGFLVWTVAACLLPVGLFLIPHRRREADAAPQFV